MRCMESVGGDHARNRPVLKIDRETGEVVYRYASIYSAMKDIGISKSKISDVCNGHRCTAGGFIWVDDSEEGLSRIPMILARLKKHEKTTSKKVRWLGPDGQVLGEFESGTEASKVSGYLKATICEVCKGKRKLSNGESWEYIKEEEE